MGHSYTASKQCVYNFFILFKVIFKDYLMFCYVTNIMRLGFKNIPKECCPTKSPTWGLYPSSNVPAMLWEIFEMLSLKIIPRKSLPDREENHTVLYSPGILSQFLPLRGWSAFSFLSDFNLVLRKCAEEAKGSWRQKEERRAHQEVKLQIKVCVQPKFLNAWNW